MLPISASTPEPFCDIAAQIAALRDPSHPKGAVWVARGTRMPDSTGLAIATVDAGTLLTSDVGKVRRLLAVPTDDELAVILGYIEPKSHVVGEPVVVQAVDRWGAVIIEMGCSRGLVARAIDSASAYGAVRVTSLVDALCRRIRLCGRERATQ